MSINEEDLSELKEKDLIDRYKKGKDKEIVIKELYCRHKDSLHAYIFSMVKCPELSSDILHDVFIKVIDKMDDHYIDKGKWLGWVMRIAYNATIDHFRKQKKLSDVNVLVDLSYDHNDYFDNVISDISNPQEDMESKEELVRLQEFINKLPEEQKTVVILRTYYEMSFKEIAKMMKTSVNTALGRMRYARINLAKMFKDFEQREINIPT